MGIKKPHKPTEAVKPSSELNLTKKIVLMEDLPIEGTKVADRLYSQVVEDLEMETATNIKLEHNKEELLRKSDRLRQNLAQQWKELEEREKLFKKNFIDFNQFIMRNQVKREKALEGIVSYQKERKHTTALCRELDGKVKRFRHVLERMNAEIKKHRIYGEFVEALIDVDDRFQCAEDVVKRLEEFMYVREQATKSAEDYSREMQGIIRKQVSFRKTRARQIQIMHNNISKMRRIYDKVIIDSRTRFVPIVEIMTNCNMLIASDYLVTQSIIRMFTDILAKHTKVGIPTTDTTNRFKQLGEIKTNMGVLHEVLTKSRKFLLYDKISKRRISLFSALEANSKFIKVYERQQEYESTTEIQQLDAKKKSMAVLASTQSTKSITFNNNNSFHSIPYKPKVTHHTTLPPIKQRKPSRPSNRPKEQKWDLESSAKSSQAQKRFLPFILSSSSTSTMETGSWDTVRSSERYLEKVFSIINRLKSRHEKLLSKNELEDKFRKYENLYSERLKFL